MNGSTGRRRLIALLGGLTGVTLTVSAGADLAPP